MSELPDDPKLDVLIDLAARSLIAAPGRGDLRARVLARIRVGDSSEAREPSGRTRWFSRGLVTSVAMAAVLVALIFGIVRLGILKPNMSGTSSEAVSVEPVVSPALPGPPGLPGSSGLAGAPPATFDAGVGLPAVATTTVARKARPVAVVWVASSDPPPGFESIAETEMTIDPINSGGLASISAMTVETIGVQSIEIDALSQQ